MQPTVAEIQAQFEDGDRDPVEDADSQGGDGETLTFIHEVREYCYWVFTLEEPRFLD